MEQPKNAYIIKTVGGTPFTIWDTEDRGTCILIGKALITEKLENLEQAEEKINNFTDDWDFLTSTIVGLCKLIMEEKKYFN